MNDILTYWDVFETSAHRLEYRKHRYALKSKHFFFYDNTLKVLWEIIFEENLLLYAMLEEHTWFERFDAFDKALANNKYTRGFYMVKESELLSKIQQSFAHTTVAANDLKHVVYANGDEAFDFVFYGNPIIRKVETYED